MGRWGEVFCGSVRPLSEWSSPPAPLHFVARGASPYDSLLNMDFRNVQLYEATQNTDCDLQENLRRGALLCEAEKGWG